MDEAERGLVYSVTEEWKRTSESIVGPTLYVFGRLPCYEVLDFGLIR